MKAKPAQKKADFGVALVTCSSKQEAQALACGIVEARLAACVNIVPAIESIFWWEGKLDSAQELLLIIKTRKTKFVALAHYVKTHHSYQVPEIILLPIEQGHEPYLNWIRESVKGGEK